MSQLVLPSIKRLSLQHGGDFSRGKRKTARPIDTKRALHVVMRSGIAKGEMSLRHRRNLSRIEVLLTRTAQRFGIRVYRRAIASNHIHLLIRGRHRRDIQGFLRAFPGLVARLVTHAQRGRAHGKFWDKTLWTRIVDWGRAYFSAKDYVHLNTLEAEGKVPFRSRGFGAPVCAKRAERARRKKAESPHSTWPGP